MIICLIAGYIKKLLCKMSCYSEPDSDRNKFELNLSNYGTKSDLKTLQVLIHQNLSKRMIYIALNWKQINHKYIK